MSDPKYSVIYPQPVWRSLHSLWIDTLLSGTPTLRAFMLNATEHQVDFAHFVLACDAGQTMRVTYLVNEAETDAWVLLWARPEGNPWFRVTALGHHEAGLPLAWFRATESLLMDGVADRLLAAGESS